jgi:hypothetical protein
MHSHRLKADDVETAVKWWLKEQDADVYGQWTENPILQYGKSLSFHKDYVQECIQNFPD